jgi:hypothetical protein
MSTAALPDFPIPDYIAANLPSFLLLIKNLKVKSLNSPMYTTILARLAEETDNRYNAIYGGEPVSYTKASYAVPFEQHFTDDLFTVLLLTLLDQEDPMAVCHLAWTFGRLVSLTTEGPSNFIEPRAVGVLQYGGEPWQAAVLRDRQKQFVPFAQLGEEQQKDDIPLQAFKQIVDDNADMIKSLFRRLLPTEIIDQLKFTL